MCHCETVLMYIYELGDSKRGGEKAKERNSLTILIGSSSPVHLMSPLLCACTRTRRHIDHIIPRELKAHADWHVLH